MMEIEKMKTMMLERVYFYSYYCVEMLDEMVVNHMDLVKDVKTEVVAGNNWMD
jgi:hypothetical protein